jgi:glucokinase
VVSLLDPDIIVIGGGVSKIGEPLFERLRAIVPTRTVNPHARELPIVPAHFGAEAGIVGAAAVVMAP